MSHLLSAKMSRNGGTRQAASSPAGSLGWEQRFVLRGLSSVPLSSPPGQTRQFWPDGPRQEAPLPPDLAPAGRGAGGGSAPQRGACLAGRQEPGAGKPDEAGGARRILAKVKAATAGGAWARVCACASSSLRMSCPGWPLSLPQAPEGGLRPAAALLSVLPPVLPRVLTPSASAMPFLPLLGNAERLPSPGRHLRRPLCPFRVRLLRGNLELLSGAHRGSGRVRGGAAAGPRPASGPSCAPRGGGARGPGSRGGAEGGARSRAPGPVPFACAFGPPCFCPQHRRAHGPSRKDLPSHLRTCLGLVPSRPASPP